MMDGNGRNAVGIAHQTFERLESEVAPALEVGTERETTRHQVREPL